MGIIPLSVFLYLSDTTIRTVSIVNAKELIEDRIKFKLYSAEKRLTKIRNFRNVENINSSFEVRVRWEEEIECFLHQLIGAKDALLVRINQQLGLGLPIENVNLASINHELKNRNNCNLLYVLNQLASKKDSWYWNLNELRNIGAHRNVININVGVDLFENIHTGESSSDVKVYFTLEQRLEIVHYLEDSFQKMKKLIQNIINKEPMLNIK